MKVELAMILAKMTWIEMDEFAQRILEISQDDEGKPNDRHYIAQCLVWDATEALG